MTACEQVRQAVMEQLAAANVKAVPAFEQKKFIRPDGAVTVVGVRQEEMQRAGLCGYLGERYDAVSRRTVEVYGREMKAVLSLDVYAPRDAGAAACDRAADEAAQALTDRLSGGIVIGAVCFGETVWDKQYEMFVRRGTVNCKVCFTAETDGQEPEVCDYILKGVVQI